MNQFQYSPPKNQPVSTDDLIENLQLVAAKFNTEKLTQNLYAKHGKYDPSTIRRRFGTWNKALEKIGAKPGNINNYSDEALYENLLNIWQHKGSQPTQRDLSSAPSVISQNPYKRRFKTWSSAIQSFIEFANDKDISTVQNNANEPSLKKDWKRPIFTIEI